MPKMTEFERFVFEEVCGGSFVTCGELAEHGAVCGYPCITYNYDILKTFERYEDEIETIVGDFLGDTGPSIAHAFASYCTRNCYSGTHLEYVTYLVRSACEIVARELADIEEERVRRSDDA